MSFPIVVTGRHMHVHDTVREYALEKVSKLDRYNDHIQHTEIVIANDGDRKTVEMIVKTRNGGKPHVGMVEHEDTFAAIDLLMDKMKRQLERQKEKSKKNRGKHSERARGGARGAEAAPAPSPKAKEEDEELESYDEVVEKMELPE